MKTRLKHIEYGVTRSFRGQEDNYSGVLLGDWGSRQGSKKTEGAYGPDRYLCKKP